MRSLFRVRSGRRCGTGQGHGRAAELVVEGLAEDDARALLESVLPGPLDARVRDRIIADTHGNPLALLELPRGLTPAQLTGGFGVSDAIPLDGRIEESFGRQLEALPAQTRRLVQLAAADPSGDPVLVWRAAGRLAIGAGAAGPAVQAGLAEFGARVRFRHPLVRSAAYRSASVQTRQELHGALAEVTDPAVDPDRRAWHRAQAAPGPDEDVAAELEHGVPDPVAGDQVMACIVLRPGASLTPAELGAFLAGQGDIGRKQHPRFVRIASQIPRTATFKVLTRVLAADRWNTQRPGVVAPGRAPALPGVCPARRGAGDRA